MTAIGTTNYQDIQDLARRLKQFSEPAADRKMVTRYLAAKIRELRAEEELFQRASSGSLKISQTYPRAENQMARNHSPPFGD